MVVPSTSCISSIFPCWLATSSHTEIPLHLISKKKKKCLCFSVSITACFPVPHHQQPVSVTDAASMHGHRLPRKKRGERKPSFPPIDNNWLKGGGEKDLGGEGGGRSISLLPTLPSFLLFFLHLSPIFLVTRLATFLVGTGAITNTLEEEVGKKKKKELTLSDRQKKKLVENVSLAFPSLPFPSLKVPQFFCCCFPPIHSLPCTEYQQHT